MEFQFEADKQSIWEVCKDIQFGAAALSKSKSNAFIYFLGWTLFWLAILSSLTLFFEDKDLKLATYTPTLLFGAAFATLFYFQRKAIAVSQNYFLEHEHGNHGEHVFKLEQDSIEFSSPSGNVLFKTTDIVAIVLTIKNVIIYTPIWACYVPKLCMTEQELQDLISELENKTAIKALNCMPPQ